MDSFHIWYKWLLAWEGVSHVMTFDLDLYLQGLSTLFWLGIQHDSKVWVIMRRLGVSSERRRSSCSSLCRELNICLMRPTWTIFPSTLWMLFASGGSHIVIAVWMKMGLWEFVVLHMILTPFVRRTLFLFYAWFIHFNGRVFNSLRPSDAYMCQ